MHHHEAGKGSRRRPINKELFDSNYDLIFGKKCQDKCKGDPETETCLGCGRTYKEIKDAGKKSMG